VVDGVTGQVAVVDNPATSFWGVVCPDHSEEVTGRNHPLRKPGEIDSLEVLR
jgi:hypothetical protein